jgi:hypothetical protein
MGILLVIGKMVVRSMDSYPQSSLKTQRTCPQDRKGALTPALA